MKQNVDSTKEMKTEENSSSYPCLQKPRVAQEQFKNFSCMTECAMMEFYFTCKAKLLFCSPVGREVFGYNENI